MGMSPLNKQDFQSGTWLKLKEYLRTRIAEHRNENDEDLDPVKTARLRGRIDEDKILLALDQAPAQETVDD